MCLSMRALELSTLGALALCSACFNPEPPGELESDGMDDASTGGVDPGGTEELTGLDPGSSSGDPTDADDSTSSGEAPASACGDGVVQGGEECDLGGNNGDSAACTASCTIAICGDGVVHDGAEVCDDGDASALCDADCTAPACGDGVTNPLAFEQCDGDDDVLNGSCVSCVAICDPGWSRCGAGPASPCDAVIDSEASCEACGHQWQSELLRAVSHASIDSQVGPLPMLFSIQSARWGPNFVTGWAGFDLEDAGSPIYVETAWLELYTLAAEATPLVDVVVDLETGWNLEELASGTVVLARYSPFMSGASEVLELDLSELNLAATGDGWINVGFVPRGADGSWADFEGSNFPDLGPKLRLEGCF